MSVINDMLKDLDARRRLPEAQKRYTEIADLTDDVSMKPRRGLSYVWIVLGLALAIGGVFGVFNQFETLPAPVSQKLHLPSVNLQPVPAAIPEVTTSVAAAPQAITAATPDLQEAITVKTVHGSVADLSWEKRFANVEQQLKQGKAHNAAATLAALMAEKPDDLAVRQSYARVLIASGQQSRALTVLTQGLRQAPQDQTFIELKATVLQQQQHYQAALGLLNRIQPSIATATDFYSLKALVYRRLGAYQQARNVYQQLLNVDGNRSQWWLGLAVSLEQANALPQAMSAYQQAVATGQLDMPVQLDVEKHMQQLQG